MLFCSYLLVVPVAVNSYEYPSFLRIRNILLMSVTMDLLEISLRWKSNNCTLWGSAFLNFDAHDDKFIIYFENICTNSHVFAFCRSRMYLRYLQCTYQVRSSENNIVQLFSFFYYEYVFKLKLTTKNAIFDVVWANTLQILRADVMKYTE